LSTDVIVGFCGETEAQFERTLDLLRYVRFDVVHVAAYSPRRATPSERLWPDDVPREAKKRRLHAVEQLQAQIATELNARLEGTIQEVLVEGPSEAKGHRTGDRTGDRTGGATDTTLGQAGAPCATSDDPAHPGPQRWGGRTRTNKLVFFDAPYDPTGMLVDVLITATSPWFLEGQPLTPAPSRPRRLPVLSGA
ncbi:MAG TPA: hypothetical protein VHN78_03435, partial [Chloroflexota bacterium]|nr:hypothetical protein [Chloroflexota bacterium]